MFDVHETHKLNPMNNRQTRLKFLWYLPLEKIMSELYFKNCDP